jgi:hypothetical protein
MRNNAISLKTISPTIEAYQTIEILQPDGIYLLYVQKVLNVCFVGRRAKIKVAKNMYDYDIIVKRCKDKNFENIFVNFMPFHRCNQYIEI